jgi:UDP-N-acetylglucosamine 2-epimerase (non-hydrolysing)
METLERLLSAVGVVAADLPVIFPVHPRTRQQLENLSAKDHHRLSLIQPLGYLDFLCLLNNSKLVLTDSGGIQEETTALGVPCLTLRDNTERPVTITQGTNQLVGRDPEKIVAAARQILSGSVKPGSIPRLWDGHAAERIVETLLGEACPTPLPTEVSTS